MSETSVLLKAYYEALFGLLEANRDPLASRTEELLREEVKRRGFEDFDADKFEAYQEACVAFIDERIEMYDPIGSQYVYDRARALEAFELELELNWYDSRAEYVELVDVARQKAESGLTDENVRSLAEDLIREVGAFPDKSIISTYELAPAVQKLPDYAVARAIEELIVHRQ